MALNIYKYGPYEEDGTGGVAVSKNGAMTEPVEVVLPAGQTSSTVQLYLATPDENYFYTGITVTPADVMGPGDEASPPNGWLRLSADGTNWLGWGVALTGFDTVGPGVDLQQPFYVQFRVPEAEDAQIKVDLRFRVSYSKHATS